MNRASFDPGAETYVSLVTYRRSGAKVATPVWIAPCDSRLFVFSEARAGKVKRLKNNPHIQLAACDIKGRVKSIWLDGTAVRITDAATIERANRAFVKKYGVLMRLTNALARLTGRYQKRAMIAIDLHD